MSNIYDVSLYNRDLKQRFISQYGESTQKNLIYIFNISAQLEFSLGKDIYEFNREDLDNLFMAFDCESEASVASKFSIIGKYIDFAIEQGFVTSRINLVKNFSGEEYYGRYVSKIAERRKILDTKGLNDFENFCVNDQDVAVIRLLRIGARGRQEKENSLEELINIRIEDCDFNKNTITLTRNNGETRIIEVSDETLEILKDANKQEKYIRKNGEVSDWVKIKKNDKSTLHQNGYILKPSGKSNFGKITAGTIIQRINNLKELYGNPFISVTNIWLSGMVEYAKQIKQEKGNDLDKDDYIKICRRFGQNEKYWIQMRRNIKKYL